VVVVVERHDDDERIIEGGVGGANASATVRRRRTATAAVHIFAMFVSFVLPVEMCFELGIVSYLYTMIYGSLKRASYSFVLQ
jgi:hypothetical protein